MRYRPPIGRSWEWAVMAALIFPSAVSCSGQEPVGVGTDCPPDASNSNAGSSVAQDDCPTLPPALDPVLIPSQGEWEDHGEAFPAPTSGWDRRLEGAISPVSAIKKDGTYILYYVGSDGPRYDGGPANRALGAALSADGTRFQLWAGNPVLRYQPSAPGGENVVEEGVFSGSATLRRADGTVVLLFGGMEAVGPTDVSGSGVLATSSDGLSFDLGGAVLRPEDPASIGSDELFPMGLLQLPAGDWVAYYITTGSQGHDWSWAVASGSDLDRLGNHALALDSRERPYPGGSDPVWLSDDTYVVPVMRGWGGAEAVVDFRVVDVARPGDLSNVEVTAVFENMFHLTILLDREEERWFLYYLDGPGESIRVKSAPMRLAPGG